MKSDVRLGIPIFGNRLDSGLDLRDNLIPAQEGGFVALNPETGTTTQGESIEEALANLQEATELYLEEFPASSYGKPLLTTFEIPVRAA